MEVDHASHRRAGDPCAFAAHQFGKLNADTLAYLPNLMSSAALAVLASIGGQWGFLLLEAAWAAVPARTLFRGLVPAL